jgi:hypothetical protein
MQRQSFTGAIALFPGFVAAGAVSKEGKSQGINS